MSEQMHAFECARCDYNAMSADPDTIADAKFRHEDYHALQAEFAAKNTRTYECPLRDCGFTLEGTDITAGIEEHETKHLEDADTMRIVKLAEANITRPTTKTFGGGIRIALEQVTTFGMFGETESADYDLTFDKALGVDDDPSVHPSQIPALIAELERLHNVWLEQIHPNSDK